MNNERYNIYKRTHKALSSLAFEASSRIQQTDFQDATATAAAISSVRRTIRSYETHINQEDCIVYNAVTGLAPFIIAMIEQTNMRDLQLGLAIYDRLDDYPAHFKKGEAEKFAQELQTSFFSFTSVLLQHIYKEETVLNEILWKNYTDEQLVAMESSILNNMKPCEKEIYTKQILNWLSNHEIIVWISNVKDCGYHHHASHLLQSAKASLTDERWQFINRNVEVQRA
jgi:hemerythrin-like domain-containing protein